MRRRGPQRLAVLSAVTVAGLAAVALFIAIGGRMWGDFAQKDTPRGPRLFQALTSVGVDVVETDVAVWVDAGERQASVTALRELLSRTATAAGLNVDWTKSRSDEEPLPAVVVGPVTRGGIDYFLGAQASEPYRTRSGRVRTMLSIKARYAGWNGRLTALEKELGDAVMAATRVNRSRLRTFVTMTASLPAGTKRIEADAAARKVIRSLGGGKSEAVGGSNWGSLTAFAPGLGEPVRFAKHSMNLNVAWHEDGMEHRYFLVAGTPLITEDY